MRKIAMFVRLAALNDAHRLPRPLLVSVVQQKSMSSQRHFIFHNYG